MKEVSLSILDSCKKAFAVRPHPAGKPFIIGGIAATLLFSLFSSFLATIALLFTGFCLFFFRDPVRMVPQDEALVISPADGLVSKIEQGVALPAEIAGDEEEETFTKISIFLSVLDVHVNRIPVSGTVSRKTYKPGKFFNADLDKASEHNERCAALIETEKYGPIGVVQIAGLIARRIVNDLKAEQPVSAGERFGIIRFGSRVDVYMPQNADILACVGQRTVGGETVLADLNGTGKLRQGEAE